MSDPIRGNWTYATADGNHVLSVDVPFGLMLPPVITAHVPLSGPLEFYAADCYPDVRARIDAGARKRDIRGREKASA